MQEVAGILERSGGIFPISRKFALAMMLTTLVVLSVTGVVNHYQSQKALKQAIKRHLHSVASLQALAINQVVTNNLERLALVSSRTQLRLSLNDINKNPLKPERHILKVGKIIHDAMSAIDGLHSLTVLTPDNEIVASTTRDQAFADLIQKIEWDELREGSAARIAINHRPDGLVSILYKDVLSLNNRAIGYIIAESNSDSLARVYHNPIGFEDSAETIIVKEDDDGRLVTVFSNPEEKQRQKKLTINPFDIPVALEGSLFTAVDYRGVEVFAGTQRIPEMNWAIIFKIDKHRAMEPIVARRNFLIISLIAATLAALVVAIYFSRTVTRPILDLTSVAVLIANGDLSHRIKKLTNDELGLLANAFNRMADKLIEANDLLEERVLEKTHEVLDVNAKLVMANQELERISLEDPLTGVANRRAFDRRLIQEWKRCSRDNVPLGLILIDIDFFKKFNDLAGHQGGDVCLSKVARCLQNQALRESDLLARYGGEEFVMILPNTTSDNAGTVASRIQAALAEMAIPHPGSSVSKAVTVSMGVGSLIPDSKNSPTSFVEAVDSALYAAKEKGRNRFVRVDLQEDPTNAPTTPHSHQSGGNLDGLEGYPTT